MHYIIDGYNLIGKIHSISFSDIDKEEKLLEYLSNRIKKYNDAFLIIFDGKRSNSLYGSFYHKTRFKVRFTPSGQSADEYMIEYFASLKQKTGVIAVTSDNAIIRAAHLNRIEVIKSEIFLRDYHAFGPAEKVPEKVWNEKADLDYWHQRFLEKRNHD